MDSEDENTLVYAYACTLFASTALCAAEAAKRKRVKRRYKVKPMNRFRESRGMFNNIVKYMLLLDEDSFFQCTRMTPNLYRYMLELLKPHLQKDKTKIPISPAQRLILTLHYLSEGCSMRELSVGYLLGNATVSAIIRETLPIIWNVLAPLYLDPPKEETWASIRNGFYKLWNFPNCFGAIDGKHVAIQLPKHSGSQFFNYKKHHSIVLMASCDAFYKFTLVDISAPGSSHDAAVYKNRSFGSATLSGRLNLPPITSLPKSETELPHFFVGDAVFPLSENIMRPYPGVHLDNKKRIFNYRLSRARRTIENAFGILSQRWRILRRTIVADLSTCEDIVKATVCLHNFLQKQEEDIPEESRRYCPTGFCDTVQNDGTVTQGTWRQEEQALRSVRRLGNKNPKLRFKINRDRLCEYLNSPSGAVPWQMAHILAGSLPSNLA